MRDYSNSRALAVIPRSPVLVVVAGAGGPCGYKITAGYTLQIRHQERAPIPKVISRLRSSWSLYATLSSGRKSFFSITASTPPSDIYNRKRASRCAGRIPANLDMDPHSLRVFIHSSACRCASATCTGVISFSISSWFSFASS